ncbi:MAG: DNA repair protein RecO [Gammaproteobacteria bacterium]|nr:MAG: DNA repair protein RecO [Gammaproteobacteria bacterium]
MNVFKQPCFIMHHINYGNNSKILKLLSRDYGMISLLAKGAKQSKKHKFLCLQPFTALAVSYRDNQKLSVASKWEATDNRYHRLKGVKLMSAIYLNELIYRLLPHSLGCPVIFYLYKNTLKDLNQNINIHQVLRNFEFSLIEFLGFGLDFSYDFKNTEPIKKDCFYHIFPQRGVTIAYDKKLLSYSGSIILQLLQKKYDVAVNYWQIKEIAKTLIRPHLTKQLLSINNVFK